MHRLIVVLVKAHVSPLKKCALQKYSLYKDALNCALQKLGKYYSKFDQKNVYILILSMFYLNLLW
jgi:hypothetical protein